MKISLYKHFEEKANQVSGKILIWVWDWSEKLAVYWEILTWIFIMKQQFWTFHLK